MSEFPDGLGLQPIMKLSNEQDKDLPKFNKIVPIDNTPKPEPRKGWLPRDKRKTILLLSDDLRMPSGVGVMSRHIVEGTCHRYNWIQLAAAINHPEVGRALDASDSLAQTTGVEGAFLRIYPYNGYGDMNILRYLIRQEKPDGILHFTDPRFWIWLYQMEHEIRTKMPLMFYHIWDDLPFPRYNENYYRSVDSIFCISKQTYNIVKQVSVQEPKKDWELKYIPHGVDEKIFRKIDKDSDEYNAVLEYRQKMFGDDYDKVKFVVLYNNRNIRRKMTSDVILAYRHFLLSLPKEKQEECRLLLHTHPVDENGTNLFEVFKDVAPEVKYVFSTDKVTADIMNLIYNNVDVVINLASNEGFGLGTLEGILAERMIVANVTGGLQDQMGFTDDKGAYLDPDKHFNRKWGTNADGKYTKHGEWVVPVWPNNRSLIGSPPTPYIFDDRCNFLDAGDALIDVYNQTPEERAENGRLGREWAIKTGLTAEQMCNSFIEGIDTTFEKWQPRQLVGLYKAEDRKWDPINKDVLTVYEGK